jgi:predicted Zn-dependent protease
MSFAMMSGADVSSTELLPLEKDLRVLFYETGIVAVNNLMGYEALQLYTELHQAEPGAPYPLVGLGMVALATGDIHAAKRYFTDPIVLESPLAAYAQGFLALAYKLSGNQGGFEEASHAANAASNGELDGAMAEIRDAHIDLSQA